ncbi:hypothetical protein AGMMS49975_02010 [Clostridia bacterium]|nr:hypothetical protein AGMMS49975_02010 [Clostridia bacterium]
MNDKLGTMIKGNYHQVLFIFAAFLVMVLVSYFYVNNIVHNDMSSLAKASAERAETAVEAAFSQMDTSFAVVCQSTQELLDLGADNAEILKHLRVYSEIYNSDMPDFLRLSGCVDGVFIDASGWIPPEDFDMYSRPWYIGAMAEPGEHYISNPYASARGNGKSISISRTLRRNGEICGVLLMELSFNQLSKTIVEQRISGEGYGVLLNEDFEFVVYPDERMIGRNMSEAVGFEQIYANLRMQKPVYNQNFYDTENTSNIAFFQQAQNGWYIGIITPTVSYYESIYSFMMTICVLGLVLMCTSVYILISSYLEKLHSEEENASKSSFLARMSHEIRTPMNAIIGMTGIAQKTRDINKIQECLTKVSDAADHLLGVINDILDISKIESGKLELSSTDFLVSHMIDRVTNVTLFKVQKNQQKFVVKVEDDVPKAIVADMQRLSQVITNLLSNSNKFTPEGGTISLFIKCSSKSASSCTLRIEVKDTGIGISDEQKKRLFRSFEQADNSTSRKFGGTGLGLAISKNIVEMMGGEIWIESELGKGTSFIFTIKAGIGISDYINSFGNLDWAKLKIAVVDPREDVMRYFTGIAATLDCKFQYILDGFDALKKISERNRPDLLFVDYNMRGLDGIQVAREIREKDLADSIVLMSIPPDIVKARETDDKYFDDYLKKPLIPTEIIDCIYRYMQKNTQTAGEDAADIQDEEEDITFVGKHILIVEDVDINREIITALLEPTEIEIDLAENGQEALDMFIAGHEKYDMIFMDLQMPVMDGLTATQRIRLLPISRAETIPIVAMTANVFSEDIEKCIQAGMNDHVGKPVDIGEVLDKMKRYLYA